MRQRSSVLLSPVALMHINAQGIGHKMAPLGTTLSFARLAKSKSWRAECMNPMSLTSYYTSYHNRILKVKLHNQCISQCSALTPQFSISFMNREDLRRAKRTHFRRGPVEGRRKAIFTQPLKVKVIRWLRFQSTRDSNFLKLNRWFPVENQFRFGKLPQRRYGL